MKYSKRGKILERLENNPTDLDLLLESYQFSGRSRYTSVDDLIEAIKRGLIKLLEDKNFPAIYGHLTGTQFRFNKENTKELFDKLKNSTYDFYDYVNRIVCMNKCGKEHKKGYDCSLFI